MTTDEGDLVGRPQPAAELTAYQDGAVVSRTIIKKPAGTVTLFAFDRGQSLSEHTTPYDALVSLLDGEGEFTIGGEAHTVKQGQMIVLPANVPHSVQAISRFKMMLTMIRS